MTPPEPVPTIGHVSDDARARVSALMEELGIGEKIAAEDWRALAGAITAVWTDGAVYGADKMLNVSAEVIAEGASRV